MARDTSIEAYNKIKADGLLGKRRFQVYQELYFNGPKTANQVVRTIQADHPDIKDASLHGRLSELRDLGVVREVGFHNDEISGNRNILWDVTSHLPVKPPKKPTRKERKEIIKDLLKGVVDTVIMPDDKVEDLREAWKHIREL